MELFDDLARMEITTAAGLERAYKSDSKLLWRLMSCLSNIELLYGRFLLRRPVSIMISLNKLLLGFIAMLGEQLTQNMTWCEEFRVYFRRCRVSFGVHLY